jgi:HK97 family phage portal protein
MGLIANMERRMAAGTAGLADSWYQPGGAFYGGSGIKTKSGASVSELNAMQLAVVWCCIKILAEDAASLPLHLYKVRKSGGKDKATADDRYFLMHDRPNPEMTAMSFREACMAHLLSWGNSYAEIERTGGRINRPVALWPITPNRVTVKRDDHRKLIYEVKMAGAGLPGVVLPKEKVLHTPGLSFNGIVGYSPIGAAREAIGLGKTLEEYGASYFENGIHPSFIISSKVPIKDTKVRREALEEVHGGLGHAHRVMFIEEAEKVERLGIPNNEAQFLEARKFTNVDIGTRIYRLHPHMYGEFDKAIGFNSAEQFAIDYATKTLRAWLVRLEQSYNMALLDPSEYGVYFFKHNMEGLLRGDAKSRNEALQIQRRNGVINANQWNEIEDRNPLEGDQGKKYIVEKNMVDLNDLGKVAAEPYQRRMQGRQRETAL